MSSFFDMKTKAEAQTFPREEAAHKCPLLRGMDMTAPGEWFEICGVGTFLVCSFSQRSQFPHGSVHHHHTLLQSIRGPSAAAPACYNQSAKTPPEARALSHLRREHRPCVTKEAWVWCL